MNVKFVFALLFSIFVGQSALAADGSSGCGPGWYVFKDNSLVSSAFRTTTNVFLFPVVTFGMTFGTSNCTKHKIVLHEKESLYFVTMNYFELKSDIAKGEGEYISAFSSTLGCPSTTSPMVAEKFKERFKQIYKYNETNPEKVLFEVYKVILTDPQLTNQCSLNVG